MAEHQILALSGKSRGVLRMEYEKELSFSLESPAYLRGAELWLLFSNADWIILEECKGKCKLPARKVRAAAVARDGAFIMTGGQADFSAARSACFTRQEKKRLKELETAAQPGIKKAPEQSKQAAGQVFQGEKRREQPQKAKAAEQKIAEALPEETIKIEKPLEKKIEDASSKEEGRQRDSESLGRLPSQAPPEPKQMEERAEKVPGYVSAQALEELKRAAERATSGQRPGAPSVSQMRQGNMGSAPGGERQRAKRENQPSMPSVPRGSGSASGKPSVAEAKKENRPAQQAALMRDEKKTQQYACVEKVEKTVQPFPKIFPSSRWVKVEYPAFPGRGYYLSGEIFQGEVCSAKALAVPGRYALNPPAWLKGFETYLEDANAQGYWLLFQDMQGKPISIAQVFRDLQAQC